MKGMKLGLILVSIIFLTNSCSEKKKNNKSEIGFDKEIENFISKMSIAEKVGQMTQINIDVISKGEIFNLVKPHQLDSLKLDSAINHYFVGSILNVGGHTYTRDRWEKIITQIQTKAITEGNKIPVIYGIDAKLTSLFFGSRVTF